MVEEHTPTTEETFDLVESMAPDAEQLRQLQRDRNARTAVSVIEKLRQLTLINASSVIRLNNVGYLDAPVVTVLEGMGYTVTLNDEFGGSWHSVEV